MLALFLHASGSATPDNDWVAGLREQGHRLFSHRALEGVQQTQATLEQLGDLCLEIQQAAPDHPLVVLRYPLNPSPSAMQDLAALLTHAPGPAAYTTFSNADPDCNPWAGLAAEHLEPATRAGLAAAYVDRPDEYGKHREPHLPGKQHYVCEAPDYASFAEQLVNPAYLKSVSS